MSRADDTDDLVLEVRRRGDADAVHTWTLAEFTGVPTDDGGRFGFSDEDGNERLLLTPDELLELKEVLE
ncbi:hypothetical protein EGH25_11080 [Haladaptatus sp. F3-133]|uniref:Uncharacterized protein n=1 Tax=Halorutilus salinus TaxID=2487751 RepID=A0A9Q4GJG2_9EURY|nr:hypothetical protein [Halorutilus salinus]MCX2819893.1 hypothetical protein [Halorutilus salinus]